MNAFWYAIADFFEFCFRILEKMGNTFNLILIIIGFVFTFYWIREMYRNPDRPEHKAKSQQ